MTPGTQMILEITPEEGGSVAGNTQTAAAAAATEGMKMTAEKEPRKLSAEFVAAAGRATVTAAGSREADSVDAAGLWTAAEDMELGTADGAAGTAAENMQAAMSEVVEVETEAVAAADKKAESEGSGMEAAENMEAAAAGDEGFAGCNMESGFAAHTHWDPAVHKAESAVHTRCCSLYFASCFAFPWDISGESAAHTAVRDSHVLAVAPPEVPAVVCMGCFLRMAEASSSPSDPLGLKAAGSCRGSARCRCCSRGSWARGGSSAGLRRPRPSPGCCPRRTARPYPRLPGLWLLLLLLRPLLLPRPAARRYSRPRGTPGSRGRSWGR